MASRAKAGLDRGPILEPVEGVPLFAGGSRAETVLASCDGRAAHVPFPATVDGVRACAGGIESVPFPRAEVAAILEKYNRSIGAPAAALAAAARVADAGSLVVATGQQPVAFGGPMYVLYKAATAIRLAREAEAALGRPVVPVFWNASEDHDIDEVAPAAAPGRGGEVVRFRADLSAWRGREVAAVGPDERWQGGACGWASSLPVDLGAFAPRRDESWARWFSRVLGETLGVEGLVMIEPQALRGLCGPVFARAVRARAEIARLIAQSCGERSGEPGPRQFDPLGGPPLFMDRDGFRLRVVEAEGRLALRGDGVPCSPEELARLAEAEPGRFSSHAALRPVVQNALLPVVAQVMGPGEIVYHEELSRYHASAAGAARRMPVLWPRMSATMIDARAAATMARFRIAQAEAFLAEPELVARFTPGGDLAGRVAVAGRAGVEALDGLRDEVLDLDPTLERPFAKTLAAAGRAVEAFAAKVEAAEARARGFAPEKLRRLAAWIRPAGRPQERTFSWAWAVGYSGPDLTPRLVREMDVTCRCHQLLRVSASGGDKGGDSDDR